MTRLPVLHAVTDDRVIARGDVAARARIMADAGGSRIAIHVRSRSLEGRALFELAAELREITRASASWLVVNGRADIARAVAADAIVSGTGGLSVADVGTVAPGAPVGRSVHDAAEAQSAATERAAFLIAGAVFATPTHPDRPAAGTALIRDAAATGLPVIAIGGMTAVRTAEVVAAGAHGIAAIRALWDADDSATAVAAFLSEVDPSVGPSVRRSVVSIQVNGEPRTVTAGITLAGLLASLSLDPRAVVVEHNRKIVRQGGLAVTTVGDGDAIELVHFVGGG